jgi:hypothetical protein
MGLDIRLPIGLLFSVVGALLLGYGALSNKAIYQRSLDFNINLAWGGGFASIRGNHARSWIPRHKGPAASWSTLARVGHGCVHGRQA